MRWIRLQFSLRSLLLAFLVLGIGLAYGGSYVSRSVRGRYEPGCIGLGGVKSYEWAPQGFVTDFRWNSDPARFYWPLYYLDRQFWHSPLSAGEKSSYPVNETDDVAKVYKAWGALD